MGVCGWGVGWVSGCGMWVCGCVFVLVKFFFSKVILHGKKLFIIYVQN